MPLNVQLIDEKIAKFSCGKEHILMLTERTNRLLSFGIGTKGQLGLGKIENKFELTQIITNPEIKIKTICAGGWHSAFLDDNYDCYLWGWNLNGQVSSQKDNNDSVFVADPRKLHVIDELSGKEVKFKRVSLGARHSALLDTEGSLYTFGWNKYNQLFFENFRESNEEDFNVEEPIKIVEFEKKVQDVKCGCWLSAIVLLD